ncbi:sulfotransferase [Sphingomonas sp. ST-64]|uniref:Sulfotransferase n=1 Tax=Sphingomonas plantiphila TaxID=3163295 RepID=A0ABW8YI16_9SPHN
MIHADSDSHPLRVPGVAHDLERLVQTHLFVIGPNNSGSTFLRRAFENSRHSWNLDREGQHMAGFSGPRTRGSGKALIWNATPERRAEFADPAAFDWERSRRAWYFHAFARDPGASVFVTSSPPFLLQVEALRTGFRDARFIFLTRDPYAIAEGVLRRAAQQQIAADEDIVDVVAAHVIRCLADQKRNQTDFASCGIALRYEDMCADPARSAQAVRALVPALDDFTLEGAVAVKGMYREPLRDMNAQQLARMPIATRARLTERFREHETLLADFGYQLVP